MKRIAFLSVLLLFQMMMVAQTAEDCYQKGKHYYEGTNGVSEDYAEAYKWFKMAAEQGHAKGQNALGVLFENGRGVTKDCAEALKWYQKAAEQGSDKAQKNIGDLYYYGEGVDKDYSEAAVWYQKAANNGNRAAKNSLGWMYENGCGVTKDFAQAVKLYREAADMGSSSAQRNLGIVYEKGIGVEQDYNEAEKWFKKALETDPSYEKVKKDLARLEKKRSGKSENNGDDVEALFVKGVDYYLGRNGVQKNLTEALKWFLKAAEAGSLDAQKNVAMMYWQGQGVKKDYVMAAKWYKKTAEQGDAESQHNIGYMYNHGLGVQKSIGEATKWYKKAAEQGYLGSQMNLGNIYYNGDGVQKDFVEAMKWYRKAAEQGNSEAQYNLGCAFSEGIGLAKDEMEAVKWFHKAAEQGYSNAQYNLGCIYRDGEGVRQDFVESNKWYLKAAKQGHAEAQTSIGLSYMRGRGGYTKDYQKALEWYQKAAAQNNINAMLNIGTFYMNEERDLGKAEEWYKKALKIDPNFKEAKESLERLERNKKNGTTTISVTVDVDKSTEENKEILMPLLEIVSNSLQFIDPSGANAIKANGKYVIRFQVTNTGKAIAKNCWVNVSAEGDRRNITIHHTKIDSIKIGDTKTVEIPITTGQEICNGQVIFGVEVGGSDGLRSNEQHLAVSTQGIELPLVRITDYSLTAASGKVLKKKEPFDLQLILQNIDLGQADDISIELEIPEKVLMLDGKESESFPKLEGGEAKSLVYSLIVRNDYTEPIIPITVHLKERTGKYAKDRTITLTLDQSFASAKLSTNNFKSGKGFDMATGTSDVDKDIPIVKRTQDKTFVLIIANENYEEVAPVFYAANDGAIFKTYCQQALGIPEDNIHIISDATLGKMRRQIEWLQEIMEAYRGEARIIFYYAGHGIPDEKNKTAYLLPVDGFGRDVKTAYALDELYASLVKQPSKSVMVFLDACFSGSTREGNMLVEARGVAIKVKQSAPEGNLVVFSAAQGDETAYPYNEQQHGMFTYFLLKKLKETKIDLTLGDLTDYVTQQVMQQSLKRNGKMQTPTVLSSTTLGNSWKEMRIK